jgi:hypothetical protein
MELQNIQLDPIKHSPHQLDSRINKQSDQRARPTDGSVNLSRNFRRHVPGACSVEHAAYGISAQ